MLTRLHTHFETHLQSYISDWEQLLRFASVSSREDGRSACRACAEWLSRFLEQNGFTARVQPTDGNPLVLATRPAPPGAPTILVYGHYDVQPAEPVSEWTAPPFEPSWRGDRLYARGAQDNKGQLMYTLQAIRALIELDALPVGITVLLEGDEEHGSAPTQAALGPLAPELQAETLLVCDTGAAPDGAPAVVLGLRGLVHLALEMRGAHHDLHSGQHGGAAPNAAAGLAAVLASLHAPDGSVAVAGFYDGVIPPTAAEQDALDTHPFDVATYRAETGVSPVAGETAYPPDVRIGFRPALDVNGFASGCVESVKTIIPARAVARVTARLVHGQDPDACLNAIQRHCLERVPAGLTLTVTDAGSHGSGFRLDPEHPAVQRACAALAAVTGRTARLTWEGASIPIIPALAATSGAVPLLVGFGEEADCAHAPDESFSLRQYRDGFLAIGTLLSGWPHGEARR